MILVTGGSGLLGRAIMLELNKESVQAIGTGFTRATGALVHLNLLEVNSIEPFLLTHKPRIVVHSAAERRPDVAAKNEAQTVMLNVGTCTELARLSVKLGFYLIYLSTDYVFDGVNPPYSPESEPNPLNFYGRCKLKGELEIQKLAPKNSLILRVPVLYGDTDVNSESAILVLVDEVLDSKTMKMDNYCLRYPTNTCDVAKVIAQICCQPL